VEWIGEGPHLDYLEALVNSDRFDVSEIESPTLALWPKPCDPNWLSESLTPDPLFINLMEILVQNDPGIHSLPSFSCVIKITSHGF